MWLPGSGFRVKLEEVRGHVRRMMDVPYEMVKELYVSTISPYLTSQLANLPAYPHIQTKGTATPCLTSSLLESHLSAREHDTRRLSEMEEMDVKGVAAVLYAGAFFLFVCLSIFFAVIQLLPNVWLCNIRFSV